MNQPIKHGSGRSLWLIAGLALILGAVNFSVWQKERLLSQGTPVLLRLAPVDPRSLMQGDYMRLDYALTRALPKPVAVGPRTQPVRLLLDAQGIATAIEPAGDEAAAGEARMVLRRDGTRQWRLGSDAYFFQEGTGHLYAQARFGEYRVEASGESVLVALRDEKLQRIGVYRLGHRWQVPSASPLSR